MTIVVGRREKRFTMDGAASSINSRSTAIKTISLAAWRGKLSNEEWEARIRKVLPKGVNGDVYDLADCLLKQALVGPVPNQLFISYLKHAVACQLVSHGAVIGSIAHQTINIRSYTANTNTNYNNNHGGYGNLITANRTSSVICLLDFLKTFRDHISCKGTELECLNLCHSLSLLIDWLLRCIQTALEIMSTNPPNIAANAIITNTGANVGSASGGIGPLSNTSAGNINLAHHESTMGIIELCTETVNYFVSRPFTKSLLFIGKVEYTKVFEDILNNVQQIHQKLSNFPNLQFVQERVEHFKILQQIDVIFNSKDMHPSVVAAQQLKCLKMHRIKSAHLTAGRVPQQPDFQSSATIHDSNLNYALFNSLYSLVAFDVILRPARSHKLLARQIATITNFNSAPINMTYCELIRVCMIGLIDSTNSPAKINWAFFTFLKMPKLLLELSKIYRNPSTFSDDPLSMIMSASKPMDCFESNQVTNFINDLKLAFERLCEYSPLLDEAEHTSNCDIFKCLVKELIKNDPGLIHLKNVDFKKFTIRRTSISNNEGSVGGHTILKTEPIVTSLLQTLDSEHEHLFDILSNLVSGRQFEFTLNCIASFGRLQMIVEKLIDQNESHHNQKSESNIPALNFDITFLILTYIAQRYGPDVIPPGQHSTFGKWFHESYNPETRINCPKELLKNSNGEVVSSLLKQLVQPDGGGIQMKGVNWREVCQNLPSAINEILNAWHQGILSDEDMEGVIERIKSKMCFVAVVVASWLQSHIRTLNEADKTKPLHLMHSLTKGSQQAKQLQQQQSSTETGSSSATTTASTSSSSSPKSEKYQERSSLMSSIIKKKYFELVPNKSPPSNAINSSTATTQQPAASAGPSTSATTPVVATQIASNASQPDPSTAESKDEFGYHSINDRFLSTRTTQEIFMANVSQCLSRGWIDHKSLVSLSSLFKMIGSERFTSLIVEQVLTSHESPGDLARAVNITFGLFHLNIEACAFALLQDTIPSWLMGEKKQVLLNQPRAFALAHLSVMTIIEVFSNLRSSQLEQQQQSERSTDRRVSLNGIIKQEPNNSLPRTILLDGAEDNLPTSVGNNGPSAKRLKLGQVNWSNADHREAKQGVAQRLAKLDACVLDLMRLFKEIMSDTVMSQRTLFPVLFLQQTVVCTREGSSAITVHLQPEILLDIISLFSSELTFELVLAISNLSTTSSRKYAAKAVCQLARVKDSKLSESAAQVPSSVLAGGAQVNAEQAAGAPSSQLAPSGGRAAGSSPATPMVLG